MSPGSYLICCKTISFNGFSHAGRIGKRFMIGINKRLESGRGVGHQYQLFVSVGDSFFFPLFHTLLQQPHAGNIFQKTGCTVYSTFVGKVQGKGFIVDNSIFYFYSHQRPGSGTEIRKAFVFSRYGSYCRCGIVTRHCNNRYFAQFAFFGQTVGESTDNMSGHHYFA